MAARRRGRVQLRCRPALTPRLPSGVDGPSFGGDASAVAREELGRRPSRQGLSECLSAALVLSVQCVLFRRGYASIL